MPSELRVCWSMDEKRCPPAYGGEGEGLDGVTEVTGRIWRTRGDLEHVLNGLAELAGLMDAADRSDYIVQVFVRQRRP